MSIVFGAIALVLVGLLISGIEYFLMNRGAKTKELIFSFIKNTIVLNLTTLAIMKYVLKIPNVFYVRLHGPMYILKYIVMALVIGCVYLFVKGVIEGKLYYERTQEKQSAGKIIGKIVSILLFTVGAAAFTATIWGKKTFGDITPDQFLVNLNSPIVGTSSDIMNTAFEGPLFETAVLTALFSCFVCSPYKLLLKTKESVKMLFGSALRLALSIVLSIAVLVGGVAFGVEKFQLIEVYHAYASDSKYIEENYTDPRDVALSFPEKKRNIIHIYLESIENSYLSKELGGFMKDNLMPELTELAGEGIHFSHNENTFGGAIQTTGSGWSVAGMVNMEMGLPMKIPMEGNYGKSGKFLPGAISIGDILSSQGYEQTIMLGSDCDFGGLTTYFTTHGNYTVFDHKEAKNRGLIPQDYNVWWGYEDDKLYEYAKEELTRLSNTGKPFNFEMETADTHFPDGYLSPGVQDKYGSQYANVIAFSTAETVKFVRWIQEQPFYENTTIVLTGDHLSMDQNFFRDFDPSYRRTTFNLFLNTPAVPETSTYARAFAPFDMYPTILASMGVRIEGEKLGLGTNLFSGKPTLLEQDTFNHINKEFTDRSNFYNEYFISEKKNSKFDTKNVTTY